MKRMDRSRKLKGFGALFIVLMAFYCPVTQASFHTWDINEIFSNADGSIQYIEMYESQKFDGQVKITVTAATFTTTNNIFLCSENLNSIFTANKYFLLATEAFADLDGAPVPDCFIPENFFSVTGDTINFGTLDSLTFGPGDLPLDGLHSLHFDLSVEVNSPTAFSVNSAAGFITAPLSDPLVETIEQGDKSIELELVAGGLTSPLVLTHADDDSGRLFIADQTGVVWILREGVVLAEPFLDMTERIVELGFFGTFDANDFDERGLLGFAFHPFYDEPNQAGFGKVYTYSSEPNLGEADFTVILSPNDLFDHQSVIAEWCVDPNDPDRINPASRREIMRIDQPQFNHDGGTVAFGPNEYLYISFGDGGGANDQDFDQSDNGHGPSGNGQNIATILGSLVRINPLEPNETPDSPDLVSSNGRYRIPPDNPFVGEAGLDEIFAYGLRNPFRFSFDQLTGDLILADVGQDHIEEINIIQAGGNYGWNLKEGMFDFDPNTGNVTTYLDSAAELIDPVLQYDHDEGISVIGGFVYQGCGIHSLAGKYIFGDFARDFNDPNGRLFYSDLASGVIQEFVLGQDDRDLGLYVKSFGQDAQGEIYLLAGTNLGPFGTNSGVYKLVSIEPPAPPEITRLIVRAGRDRNLPLDKIKISGTFHCDTPQTDEIYLRITDASETYGFSQTLSGLTAESFAKGRFRHRGEPIGLRSLKIDFNKGKFSIIVNKVNLSGLTSPISLYLQAGPLDLRLSADETIINKRRPIPICLLSGIDDALRIDKATVRTRSGGDSLKIKGGIVTEDLALDLTGKAVEISWGDFSETLEIASFVQIRGRKYIYKKPREKVAAITKIIIDFDKCKLTLQMKNAPTLQKQGSVVLEIIADSFIVNDTFTF